METKMKVKSPKEVDTISRNRAWYLLAGVVVGTALTFGGLALLRMSLQGAPAGDDDPILVAGGSLHLAGTKGNFTQSGRDAAYQPATGKTKTVDILYYDQGHRPKFVTQPFKNNSVLQIQYCPTRGECETVSIQPADAKNGEGLLFRPATNAAIDPADKSLSLLPEDGHIENITLDGSTYTCEDKKEKGRCSVVLHYRCTGLFCSW